MGHGKASRNVSLQWDAILNFFHENASWRIICEHTAFAFDAQWRDAPHRDASSVSYFLGFYLLYIIIILNNSFFQFFVPLVTLKNIGGFMH